MAIYKDVEPLEVVAYKGESEDFDKGVKFILEQLDALPTADVAEVKHGEWVVKNNEKDWKDQNSYRVDIECSECGKSHFLGTTKFANEFNPERLNKLDTYADYTFCGRCGAKMDGGKM